MSEPTAPNLVAAQVAETRRRHERSIAGIGLLVAAVTLGIAAWRGTQLESAGAAGVGVAGVVIALVYGGVLLATREAPLPLWVQWALSTFEVAIVGAVVLIGREVSPGYAMTSVAWWGFPLAIVLSGLRLRVPLPMYVAGLSAVAAAVLHTLAGGDAAAPLTSLTTPFVVQRALLFLLMGLAGATLARAQQRMLAQVADESDRRARVRAAFGTYVADQVVERVLAGDLVPRTERREISVMFVDIRGFTRLSEHMEPEDLVAQLNQALEAFGGAIQDNGGIVNKYLGDGLMAIFGAPEIQEDHADRALRATRGVLEAARDLRERGAFPDLRIGVGVHCGDVVVGDVGGEKQREYTAIGDVVNVASRVESANKELGTEALFTGAAKARLRDATGLRPLPPIQVRNRQQAVEVWTLDPAG
jgi:adenylate cyclase